MRAVLFSALLLAAAAAVVSAAVVTDRGVSVSGDVVPGHLEAAGDMHTFKVHCPRGTAPYEGPSRTVLVVWLKTERPDTVHLYASAEGMATAVRHSWSTLSGRLEVDSTGAVWPESGVFYVSALGTTPSSYELSSSCSLAKVLPAARRSAAPASVVSPATASTNLAFGVPLNGSATSSSPEYFVLTATSQAGCNVTLSLATLGGDPDLYISNVNPTPGPTNYTQRSAAWGDDSLVVLNVPASSKIYIAVLSFTVSTNFMLSASQVCATSNVAVQLQNGVPVAGSGTGYFFVAAGTQSALTIELSPLSGDPDLYVAVNRPVSQNPGGYDWVSRAVGADSLTILSSDPRFCHTAPCQYNIMVVPFGGRPSEYSITASYGDLINVELQEGIPYEDSGIAGGYQYYQITSANAGSPQDFTVVVTGAQGDPDVFVGVGTMTHPSMNGSIWASRLVGSDAVTVPSTDPHNSAGATFYIGVQCYGRVGCTYTVVGTFSDPTELLDGQPEAGAVGAGSFNYYVVEADPGSVQHVTFRLEPMFDNSQCNMYVALGQEPTRLRYDNVSHWYDSAQEIVMTVPSTPCNQDDPTLPPICLYFVGVSGTGNCSYSITASLDSPLSATQLLDGVPVPSTLAAGSYDYYRFDNDLSLGSPIYFRVTCLSGDADIYVTVPPNAYPQPSTTIYNLSSRNYGDDVVTVPTGSMGTYYAAVYGFTNTSYSITAEQSTLSVLEEGTPLEEAVPRYTYTYFLYNVPSTHGDLVINVECVQGSVNMYLSDTNQFPTASNFQFSGVSSITVPSSLLSDSQYYLGLYAPSGNALCDVTASSSQGTLIDLEAGVAVRGRIPTQGTYVYYRYYHTGISSVRFILTPSGDSNPGDTDLYVSSEVQYPNTSSWDWVSNSFHTEVVVVEPSDPHYCYSCNFYVSAYAYTSNCSYTVVADEVDVNYLQMGYTQRDSVLASNYSYFNLYTVTTAATVTFTVQTPTGGAPASVDLLVNRGSTFPSEAQYQWKTTSHNGAATLAITQPNSPFGCDSFSCVYKVSVYGNTDSDFLILATIMG